MQMHYMIGLWCLDKPKVLNEGNYDSHWTELLCNRIVLLFVKTVSSNKSPQLIHGNNIKFPIILVLMRGGYCMQTAERMVLLSTNLLRERERERERFRQWIYSEVSCERTTIARDASNAPHIIKKQISSLAHYWHIIPFTLVTFSVFQTWFDRLLTTWHYSYCYFMFFVAINYIYTVHKSGALCS